jgi:hypothetical protein
VEEELPIYCVIDTRPVKVVEDGGDLVVLAWDTRSGEFVRRMDLLERVVLQDERFTELTEDEFDQHLNALLEQDSLRAG